VSATPLESPRWRVVAASATGLESLRWRYPEWWAVGLSVAAWGVLGARAWVGQAAHHPLATAAALPGRAVGAGVGAWAELTAAWVLMALAMMVPLVVFALRVTAARSLWRRRDRAIGEFLLGYLGAWLAAGAGFAALDVILSLETWLRPLPWLGGAIGFAVAALWQLAPARRRALQACHRTVPLAPHGWRADRDCVRFGWLTGGQCLLSCWPLMVACALVDHGLSAMLCAAAIGAAERYGVRPRQTAQRPMFGPLLSIALVYGILGLSPLPAV